MTMNKKERSEFDAAILRAETLAALRWTAPVEKDVPPPRTGYSQGWDFNTYTKKVGMYWSGQVVHGDGPAPATGERHRYGSQNCKTLFSTEAKALAALRHAIECETAAELLKIDKRIAAAIGEQSK